MKNVIDELERDKERSETLIKEYELTKNNEKNMIK